jgi:hypothetical protein
MRFVLPYDPTNRRDTITFVGLGALPHTAAGADVVVTVPRIAVYRFLAHDEDSGEH